jgi:hypothetical protein
VIAGRSKKAPLLMESGSLIVSSGGDYSVESFSFFSAGMGSDLASGLVMSSR